MIELEKEFIGIGEVKGFKFKQIKCNDCAYVYEVKSEFNNNKYYEVFVRRISKGNDMMIAGIEVHFEEKEIYPKANSFGIWAWTYTSYDKAIEKFNDITENSINREIKQKLT